MSVWSFLSYFKPGTMNRRAHRGMLGLTVLLSWLIHLGCSNPVNAQADGPPSDLTRYRDSISQLQDSTVLAGELERLRRVPSTENLLRTGIVTLALADRGAEWLYDRAADTFQRAAQLEPGWPWPHFGLGLAEAGKARREISDPLSIGKRIGYGAFERALKADLEALSLDPEFAPALIAIDSLVQILGDTGSTALALTAFRRAAGTSAGLGPEILLRRGRLERMAGSPDSALSVIARYQRYQGEDGLGDLEMARAYFSAGRLEGVEPYYEGARFDDSATVTAYRNDLAYLADSADLLGFDRSKGDARVTFLRHFWAERDDYDLRESGSRLMEHYRRLDYARHHFALQVNRRFYRPEDAYRSHSTEFDDRGLVYIRQGPPTVRIAMPIPGFFPNETWKYERADGDLLLHFSGGGGVSPDGKVVSSGDPSDQHLIPGLLYSGSPGPGDTIGLMLSRSQVTDLYNKYLGWGREGRRHVLEQERAIVTTSIALATSTDADELRFEHPLNAVHELISLGTQGNRTLVHAIFAVPVLPGDTGAAQVQIPIRARLGVFGTRGLAARVDSSQVLRVRGRVAAGGWIIGRITLSVPPGHWTYRLVLERDSTTGMVFPFDSVRVPQLDGSVVAISDLVVGPAPGGWPWVQSSGDTAFTSPFQLYRRDQWVSLYYETLSPEVTEYSTTLSIHDRHGARSGRQRLSFRFRETSEERHHLRRINLGELQPGDYWLEVSLGGVVQRRAFSVVSR